MPVARSRPSQAKAPSQASRRLREDGTGWDEAAVVAHLGAISLLVTSGAWRSGRRPGGRGRRRLRARTSVEGSPRSPQLLVLDTGDVDGCGVGRWLRG